MGGMGRRRKNGRKKCGNNGCQNGIWKEEENMGNQKRGERRDDFIPSDKLRTVFTAKRLDSSPSLFISWLVGRNFISLFSNRKTQKQSRKNKSLKSLEFPPPPPLLVLILFWLLFFVKQQGWKEEKSWLDFGYLRGDLLFCSFFVSLRCFSLSWNSTKREREKRRESRERIGRSFFSFSFQNRTEQKKGEEEKKRWI